MGRYLGSFFGLGWAVLLPVLTLGVYVFVFGVLLTPKWPGFSDPLSFTLILVTGLLVFNLFSESLARMPSLIVTNASYVRKLVFPLHLLVLVPIASSLVNFVIGLLIWIGLAWYSGQSIWLTALWVPVIIFPVLVMIVGLGTGLAAVGCFVRDISQGIPPVLQLLLYLGPVIYPLEVVPGSIAKLVLLNPITVPVQEMRRVLVFGQPPDFAALFAYFVVALIIYVFGSFVFERARPGFADVV